MNKHKIEAKIKNWAIHVRLNAPNDGSRSHYVVDLGEPTHTLIPCGMPKQLPPRNQCTGWFAPALCCTCHEYSTEQLVHVIHHWRELQNPRDLRPQKQSHEQFSDICSVIFLTALLRSALSSWRKPPPEGQHKANTSSREWQRKPPFRTTSSQELLTTSPGNPIMFIYIFCNTFFVFSYSKVSFSNSHWFWQGLSGYVTVETSTPRSCDGVDKTSRGQHCQLTCGTE